MGQCEAMQVFDLNTGIEERCPYPGVDVDHIINLKSGGTNDLSNLQYLCTYHHRKKTEREARAARKYVSRNHPGEPHPGIKP
jgi:5-methylcytosine-specific restriction protein A